MKYSATPCRLFPRKDGYYMSSCEHPNGETLDQIFQRAPEELSRIWKKGKIIMGIAVLKKGSKEEVSKFLKFQAPIDLG